MRMNEGLDTGPMLLKGALPIRAGDTGGSLHDELAALGAALIVEALDALAAGPVSAEAQPGAGITYAAKVSKAEARIDWSEGAHAIDRKVRAFNPWPVAETVFAGAQLRIHAARPWDAQEDNLLDVPDKNRENGSIIAVRDEYFLVKCGHGLLAVAQVQQPGRRPVAARDFSHAHALLGQRLG